MFSKSTLIALLFFSISPAQAVTVQSFGSGTAVTSSDFVAEFEIDGGTPHLEDNLSFANVAPLDLSGSTHAGFAGVNDSFALYSGSVSIPLEISTQDGSKLSGIEFNIGTGYTPARNGGFWESYRDGLLVDSGGFNITNFDQVISFSDNLGFDMLLIAMLNISSLPTDFNNSNAIAVDHVVAQSLSAVPIPAAVWLFGSALIGLLGFIKRRKVA